MIPLLSSRCLGDEAKRNSIGVVSGKKERKARSKSHRNAFLPSDSMVLGKLLVYILKKPGSQDCTHSSGEKKPWENEKWEKD